MGPGAITIVLIFLLLFVSWQTIYAANRDRIRNPHLIFPGQVFVVPTGDRKWETAVN